jgi:DNA-directed RNA polymerase specialized sigma24 family protein
VLRTRFAIAFVEEAAVEEDLGDRGEEDVALRALDHDASARAIAARLSGRQLALLQSRFRDGHGLVELAHEHGCAHGTVANELRRAAVMIRELIADDDDYEPVLEMLLELSVLGEEGYDAAP